jgi:hypothetical protein
MSPPIRIREFRPLTRNSLRGFAVIELPSGLVIADVSVHVSHGKPWASPPSKPMIGKDGAVMKDANGKVRYVPIIEFRDKETRDRWSNAVIEAVRAANPEAVG